MVALASGLVYADPAPQFGLLGQLARAGKSLINQFPFNHQQQRTGSDHGHHGHAGNHGAHHGHHDARYTLLLDRDRVGFIMTVFSSFLLLSILIVL